MERFCLLALVLTFSLIDGFGQYYSKRVKGWESEIVPDASLLDHSVFLLGDLGEGKVEDCHLQGLKKQLVEVGAKGTILFLGNSVFKPEEETGEVDTLFRDTRLQFLMDMVKKFPGEVIFLPGEKEWDNGGRQGWETVRGIEEFVEDYLGRGDVFLPSDGCPGPVEVPLGNEVVLLVTDSQWWLHQGDRPAEECGFEDTSDFLILLSDALKRNRNKKIIFATHHPVYSAGKHGGHFAFPGPWELYRKVFGTPQDFAHPNYRMMRYFSKTIFRDLNEVLFVSAHENNLQFVQKDNLYQIISGSGCVTDYVAPRDMDFTAREVGFARLNFYRNHEVWLEFWTSTPESEGEPKILFRKKLYMREVVPEEELAKQYEGIDFSDSSVVMPASRLYLTQSDFKKRMLGQNYRTEWGQPVRVPVFDIGKEKGGLKIIKRGGGQQTRSLRLEDKNGKQYVLRSIEKYTEKAIPDILRGTFAADIVQDGISGSHPYGALVVPRMADAVGVFHTNPRIVFVPDDPRLGIYQNDFKNELYIFEERPDGDMSGMPWFGNSEDILSTDKVLQKRQKSSDYQVDETAVLRARLFDIYLNDWDRHDDQWRWTSSKENGKEFFRPIPRDRDQVFFYNEGIFPWLVRRKWAIRKFQPFDSITEDVVGLGFNSRYFDRTFLSSLSRKQWMEMGEEIRHNLSDEVITAAVNDMPPEVVAISGEEIIRKLKARRDHLPQMANEFYEFLARDVDVVGTDERERFKVERKPDGELTVAMYRLSKKGNRKEQLYERSFFPEETKEVRLYGLGGKDQFYIFGEGKKGITLRVIGGTGKDKIENVATGLPRKSTWVYDTEKKTQLSGNNHFRNRLSKRKDVNLYDRKSFKYNVVSPAANLDLVSDDGLIIGAGVAIKKQGFRQDPCASLHSILASYAFSYPSVKLDYKGEMNHVLRQNDLTLEMSYNSPNFQGAYYGLGNNTKLVKEEDHRYNRIRMGMFYVNPMVRRRLGMQHELSLGGFFQQADLQQTANRFVTNPSDPYYDLDPQTDFDKRKYMGFSANYAFDTRDSKINPTRGFYWQSNYKWYYGIGSADKNFHHMSTDLRFFLSFGRPQRSVLAMRVGAARNSQGYAFYQANKLGVKTNLRGFRRDRFSGDAMVYQNTDFRLRLARFRTYFLGGEMGVLGFNDFGRVWVKGEDSETWHHGYGGGVWISPFRMLMFTANFSHSKEDNILSIQFRYLF